MLILHFNHFFILSLPFFSVNLFIICFNNDLSTRAEWYEWYPNGNCWCSNSLNQIIRGFSGIFNCPSTDVIVDGFGQDGTFFSFMKFIRFTNWKAKIFRPCLVELQDIERACSSSDAQPPSLS